MQDVARILAIALSGPMLAGCSLPQPSSPLLEASPVPIARQDLSGVAWLSNGAIVVGFTPDRDDTLSRLAKVDPATGALTELPLETRPGCQREYARAPESAPGGRLGYVLVCQFSPTDNPPPRTSIAVTDLAGDGTREIGTLDPLWDRNGQFAIGPSVGQVLMSVGGFGLCSTIVSVGPGGSSLLGLLIKGDGAEFTMDVPPDPSGDCPSTGRADYPAWSPDGATIAFFASPASVGKTGQERVDAPWNLYVMDARDRQPQAVLRGISHVRGLAYSPDGRRLAFAGHVPGRGQGTWMFETASGSVLPLTQSAFNWLSWSPDGRSIAGIRAIGDEPPSLDSELVIVAAPD